MLPDIAVKALAMARDPNCSIKEFASVVERDPKLATEILRITNSAFYGARNPIMNLKQAVTRLGFAHCRNVILAASLGSAGQVPGSFGLRCLKSSTNAFRLTAMFRPISSLRLAARA